MQIVDLGNRNRIFRFGALILIAIVAMWGQASAFAISTAAAQCHESSAKTGCGHHAAMPHHNSTASNHSCCQKKPKAKRVAMTMPCCPVQQGPMPNNCGTSTAECCAVTTRDDSDRSTAKPERNTREKQPSLVASRSSGESDVRWRKTSELIQGLHYDRPVFDLKTDLRI